MSAVRRRILLGLALCLTVAALAGILQRRGDLLARAARVHLPGGLVTSERVYAGYHHRYHNVPSYGWASDSTLVTVRGAAEPDRELVEIDLETGKLIRGTHPAKPTGDPLGGCFYWAFSPAGRRVLCLSGSGQSIVCSVWSLERERLRSWTNRVDGSFEPAWLSDGTGFILWHGLVGVVRVRWYDVASGATREFRLDQARVEILENAVHLGPRRVPIPFNLQATDSAVEFLEIGGEGGELTATRRRIRVPERLRAASVKVFAAPAGDRLAWLASFEWKVPEIKHSYEFPFLSAQRRSTYGLFVSGTDGSGLRPLGTFRGEEEIGEIAWTPDGKRLSFVRANALWTLPAGQP